MKNVKIEKSSANKIQRKLYNIFLWQNVRYINSFIIRLRLKRGRNLCPQNSCCNVCVEGYEERNL